MQRPRLLYVVTEDWYFMSHRLPMAHAARDAGFEVHVATRVAAHGDAIRAEGFVLHGVPFARGRLSPLAALRTVKAIRDIHHAIKPAISHHVALQPAVFASLAALDSDIICINAVTGFGYTFTSKTRKAAIVRPVLSGLLRLVLGHRDNIVLVQNPDDRASVIALGVPEHRVVTIAGSGVDITRFAPTPEPPRPIKIGFTGRLLLDKGIHTPVSAHRILRAKGRDYELHIAGRPDPANPTSVPAEKLAEWKRLPGVHFHGHLTDVAPFWADMHIAVLPSRREGLPKSLLEAAACGRPLVAPDVPGCREVVIPGKTGILVAIDEGPHLADAIETLATSIQLRREFGSAARALAESRFGTQLVAREIAALYGSIVAQSGSSARA